MKQIITKILSKEVGLKKEEIENLIEVPHSPELGDYAFPCFVLAGRFKKNPGEIAFEIKNKIKKLPKEIDEIKVSGAYINFFVNKKILSENVIKDILSKKEDFGKQNIGKGKKILIEHTSINPNASPHVGRARNAIIGDSIVKIFEFLKFKPEVHYYVNDVSKQIAILVFAKAENLKFEKMLEVYSKTAKKVMDSKEAEEKIFEILKKFEEGDKNIVKSFKRITDIAIQGQKKILSELGIHYDFFDYESRYMKSTKKILSDLEKTKKIFTDENGRKVLDLKGTSVEGKMKSPVLVLTRKDGTGLYPLRDIVYTIEKIKKSKENLIVLGEDQRLYFLQISEALKLLGYPSPKVVHYSFVLLTEKGISKKMSTRKGEVVLLEEFLKDAEKKAMEKSKNKSASKKISVAAVKYAILKNNPEKLINFNLEDSLNFEGDTGPYLLYSYVRANSILKKIKKNKKESKINDLEMKETELVKKFSQFPEIVLNSYKNFNPSVIANYSYQLCQTFNEFYHECPVIGSEREFFRKKLVESFKIVLGNCLKLLGIKTIKEM
ncbi:MAG: arginine--tRNA ligase [Nanoarchaeota archaeon]|nr:arginine--tRNA ligase [Nanoarchaeota archaeon]